MAHDLLKIGLPPAEIVIHVYSRNTAGFSPAASARRRTRNRQRAFKQLIAAWKFEIADDVNEQQDCAAIVGSAAMQIVLFA